MLSALVVTPSHGSDPPQQRGPVLRTLSGLIGVTVEGLVRDVSLLQFGETGAMAAIAEETGCTLVAGDDFAEALGRGLAGAKCPLILLLRGGAVLGREFGHEVAAAFERREGAPCNLLLRERKSGVGRFWPSIGPAVAGVVIGRQALMRRPVRSFAEAVRRARPAQSLPTPVRVLR